MVTADSRVMPPNCLRRWRKKNHVSQAQLAADLGVSPSLVSQWEQHHTVPTLKSFNSLLRHTGIPVKSLLDFFMCETPEDEVVVEFRPRARPSTGSPPS